MNNINTVIPETCLAKAASGFSMTDEILTTLPPGKYWVGDPHHAMGLEFHEFCEMTEMEGDDRTAYLPDESRVDGQVCWYQFTETGDGCYQAVKNTLPGVQVSGGGFFRSPGLIGIVPFDWTVGSSAAYSSGVTVTFSDEVTFAHVDGLLWFKSGEGELVFKSMPYKYLALGVDLSHLSPDAQAERRRYLIDQVGRFAYGLSGGYVGPAYMMNGYLQLTVHSSEDPYRVFPDFIAKLESGEIDIPEDNSEALVFKYALTSNVDFEDPICCLKEMSSDGRALDMSFEQSCSPSESVRARLEKKAEQYEVRARELAESLDKPTSGSGQVDRNEHIYDQCLVALFEMKARKLKEIAKKAATRANHREANGIGN